MTVATFMDFDDKLPDHQEMLRRGDLLAHDPETMGADSTMFISHQWSSHAHADETGTQLKTLQAIFRRLRRGDIGQVERDWKYQLVSKGNEVVTAKEWKARLPKMYLWIDFCCIPQMMIPLTEALVLGGGLESPRAGVAEAGNSRRTPPTESALKAQESFRHVAAAAKGEMLRTGNSNPGARPSFADPQFRKLHAEAISKDTDRRETKSERGTLIDGDHSAACTPQQTSKSGLDRNGSFVTSFIKLRAEAISTAEKAAIAKAKANDTAGSESTSDHRHATAGMEGWEIFNKIMLNKAVQSIPAYIERSCFIVALVPPCIHSDRDGEVCDQSSWRGRGWCRVEYLGASLVRSDVPVMLVEDPRATPSFVMPQDALSLPPGTGTYTCCARSHDFGGGPGTALCDRYSVATVLSSMIDIKVDHLWRVGKSFDARVFTALKPRFMRGLPNPAEVEKEEDAERAEIETGGESKSGKDSTGEENSKTSKTGSTRSLAKARKLFRWRDDATEAAESARTGVGLLFWCSLNDSVEAVLELAKELPHSKEATNALHIHRPGKSFFLKCGQAAWCRSSGGFTETNEPTRDASNDPGCVARPRTTHLPLHLPPTFITPTLFHRFVRVVCERLFGVICRGGLRELACGGNSLGDGRRPYGYCD